MLRCPDKKCKPVIVLNKNVHDFIMQNCIVMQITTTKGNHLMLHNKKYFNIWQSETSKAILILLQKRPRYQPCNLKLNFLSFAQCFWKPAAMIFQATLFHVYSLHLSIQVQPNEIREFGFPAIAKLNLPSTFIFYVLHIYKVKNR